MYFGELKDIPEPLRTSLSQKIAEMFTHSRLNYRCIKIENYFKVLLGTVVYLCT